MEIGTLTISSVFILLHLPQFVFSFVNLSFNKTADMSSSQYSDKWLADEAVDGDVSQKVTQGYCAVTSDNFHQQAWWRVDLGDVYLLNSVKIYYRKESDDPTESLTNWLSGFSIYVAETLNWWIGRRCYLHNNGQHTISGPSDILTVPCNATGRYVTVYKQRNNSCFWSPHDVNKRFCAQLELCEVQVQSCEDGTYGDFCTNNCSGNCQYGVHCNKAQGGCDDGCAPGYRGFYCDEVCPRGRFGVKCNSTCSEHCRNISNCRNTDGYCDVCSKGWTGRLCNENTQTPEDDKDNVIVGISVTSGIILIALSVALFLCLRLRSQSPINRKNHTDTNTNQMEQQHVQMSNIDINTQDTVTDMNQEIVTEVRNRVIYEDLMSTNIDTNAYETLKRNRAATYTNTQLV